MFTRGDGSIVSLPDASRRLQVPVDVLWKWITDGRLAAEVKPGRGSGMEYYLEPVELKRALELRDEEYRPLMVDPVTQDEAPMPKPPANVISVDFPEQPRSDSASRGTASFHPRSDAIIALENLRSEALAAIERHSGREAAITELATAVESLMNTMLEAMDRAQDNNQGRLTAELEALRVRLSRQIQDRERDDLRLRDELAATKSELTSALASMGPLATFAPAGGSRPTGDRSGPGNGDASVG